MKKNLEGEILIEKTKEEIEAIKQNWTDFKYDELRRKTEEETLKELRSE